MQKPETHLTPERSNSKPIFYFEKDVYRDIMQLLDQDEDDLLQYHKKYDGARIKILCEGSQIKTPCGHPVETGSEWLAFHLLQEMNRYGLEYHLPIMITSYFYSELDHFHKFSREFYIEIIMNYFHSDWTLACPFKDKTQAVIWRDMFSYEELRKIEFLKWLDILSIPQLGGILILAEQYKSVNLAYILSHRSRPRFAYNFNQYFKEAYIKYILPSTKRNQDLWKIRFLSGILKTYKNWAKYTHELKEGN